MKSLRILLAGVATAALTTFAIADEAATVKVPNLEVKEKLQALAQINVTADKPQQAEAVRSDEVQALLDETARIDREPTAVDTDQTQRR